MLSAELASDKYPFEAVTMMDRVIAEVEKDLYCRSVINASYSAPKSSVADRTSLRHSAALVHFAATVSYTRSG